jgi:deoxyribonuclease-4
MIRLGFHMSIAGSVANAPRNAAAMGLGCFQIFTSNARSWEHKGPGKAECAEFIKCVKGHDLAAFAHMPYICNLSSGKREVHEKSIQALVANIRDCEALGIGYLVAHLGSHLGKGVEPGMERLCDALGTALHKTERVTVLMENSSGYKNSMGSSFGDLGRILDTVGTDRLGICFDTCHAFAAGYDLSTEAGVERVVEEFESQIGASRLGLVHLNDAKFPLGSGRDRHWHIGKGFIGDQGFISLFRSKPFSRGSFVMETPMSRPGDDTMNYLATKRIIRASIGVQL